MIKEYETIIGTYDSLIEILKSKEEAILEAFDNIHKKYSKDLFNIYNSLETIMEKMASETFKNVKKSQIIDTKKKR